MGKTASDTEPMASGRDVPLTLAFGTSSKDTNPSERAMTVGDFIDLTRRPDTSRCSLTSEEFHALDKKKPDDKAARDRAKDGPYFMAVRFSRPGTRKAADVAEIFGFVLDFDSGRTQIADVAEALEGILHITYTTFSHTPSAPRLRVLIPYAHPVPPSMHPRINDHFIARFRNHPFDARCGTTSQLWYLPGCPKNAAHEFQQHVGEGRLFDPLAELPRDPIAAKVVPLHPTRAPGGTEAIAADIRSALPHIDADDRDIWIRMGMAIKRELGDAGRYLWDEWSRGSDKFNLEDSDKAWGSFATDGTGHVTIASLFHHAKENGWQSPGTQDLDAEIEVLNKTHFFARDGGKAFVFEERMNPSTGHPEVVSMSKADFQATFANRLFRTGTRKNAALTTLGDGWFSSPLRREYAGLVFAPSDAPEGYFNLWRGFAVTPTQGDWDLFRSHIEENICGGDSMLFSYVLGWLAHAVQKPTELPGVALVLRGGRGTGKSTFAKWIGAIYGSHYLQVSQPRHITGNFNSHLRNTLILFADEAFWAGDKQGEGTLKALITEPTLAVERKGIDVQTCKNFMRVVMASNNDWVVPAGGDERRYCVLDVGDAHAKDTTYFSAMEAQMKNCGVEAMLHDLLHYDIGDFDVRSAPATAALLDQKLLSMQPHEEWWYQKLRAGTIGFPSSGWGPIPTSALHQDYIDATSTGYGSRRSSETTLGIQLQKLVGKGSFERKRVADKNGVRTYMFMLPPLQQCRAAFEKRMGTTFAWED